MSRNRSEPTLTQQSSRVRPQSALRHKMKRNIDSRRARNRPKSPGVRKSNGSKKKEYADKPNNQLLSRQSNYSHKSEKSANIINIATGAESDSNISSQIKSSRKPPKAPRFQNIVNNKAQEEVEVRSCDSKLSPDSSTENIKHAEISLKPELEIATTPVDTQQAVESMSSKHLVRIHRKHMLRFFLYIHFNTNLYLFCDVCSTFVCLFSDEFMMLIKDDMSLLKDFDKGEFSKQQYVTKLNNLLQREIDSINAFKSNFPKL